MKRFLFFIYGVLSYAIFFASFLYVIAFVGNFDVNAMLPKTVGGYQLPILVPKTIDSGATSPMGVSVAINLGIIILFGLQHTVMARPGFKKAWTKIVPEPIERSTYVNFTTVILVLLFWQWRPMTDVVWNIEHAAGRKALIGLTLGGYGLVLYATFLIDHFDLFGLRQVFLCLLGKKYTSPPLATPMLYRVIRHPILLGWMIAFWATPTMTYGHLLFAIGTTVYMLIAIPFEERDLEAFLGEEYRKYKARTPKLLPWPRKA